MFLGYELNTIIVDGVINILKELIGEDEQENGKNE